MPFFSPDVMFLSVLPLFIVMLLSVDFWWSSFCGPLWGGDLYFPFDIFLFGGGSCSESLYSHYILGGGLDFHVSSFYSSVSRFSVLGGEGVYLSYKSDGYLPVTAGPWGVFKGGEVPL